MLLYALIVFLVGACGGLVLASFVLRGKLAPWAVSLLHAMLGATGIILLTTAILMDNLGTLPIIALCVFLVTAGFGFYLASMHYGKRVAMKKVVLTHASFAITGALLLIAAVVIH